MKMKKLGAFALSIATAATLATVITGCGSESDDTVTTVSPYQRVAVISGGNWGAVNPIDVDNVADKIAQYVTNTNEGGQTIEGVTIPTNWVIAGANLGGGETYEFEDLLPIPGMGSAVTGTSRVIEFCNKAYATEAIGTGRFHGSALPCEVSVHSDGTNVYVDMLDAEAIFNIFFTDAAENFTAGEMEEFAAMASAVKSELRAMIKAGLSDDNATVSGTATPVAYTESTKSMGPKFTQSDIDNDISMRNPYIIYKYQINGGGTFVKGTDDGTLAQDIIDTLGTAAATADKTPGLEGLSAGSLWRSGRPDPIAIPNVKVVEACSPKYAKKATALGNEYLTALPCEFTVYVDETDDTNSTIAVSFLNPNFMFGTMFEGAVEDAYMAGDINKSQVIEYSTLAEVVFADLRMIVDHAIQNNTIGVQLDIVE